MCEVGHVSWINTHTNKIITSAWTQTIRQGGTNTHMPITHMGNRVRVSHHALCHHISSLLSEIQVHTHHKTDENKLMISCKKTHLHAPYYQETLSLPVKWDHLHFVYALMSSFISIYTLSHTQTHKSQAYLGICTASWPVICLLCWV